MNRAQTLSHNTTYSIRQGIAGAFPNLFSQTFFPLFAISVLEATNYQVALLSSLPQILAVITVVPSAILVNRAESKRNLAFTGLLAARLILFSMALIPLLPEDYASWFFIILVGVMNIPYSLHAISWQALIADIIPSRSRTLFLAKRNRIITIASVIITLTIGIVMFTQSASDPRPYQIMFVFCGVFAVFELFFLRKQIEPQIRAEKSKRESIFSRKIFQHKSYRAFLICALPFNFAWQMGWPLMNIYFVDYCEANIFWMSILTVFSQLVQVFAFQLWAKLACRYSNTTALIFASIGLGISPILMTFTTNLVWMMVVMAISGFFVAGLILLLFNGLLESSTEELKTTFVANYNFLLGIVAFIAPQVGVFVLEKTDIQFALNLSGIMRFATGCLFIWMRVYLNKLHKTELIK